MADPYIIETLLARSEPILAFKRRHLSIVHGNCPIMKLGQVPAYPIAQVLKTIDVMTKYPSSVPVFGGVSEFPMASDLIKNNGNDLINIVSAAIRTQVSNSVGCQLKIFKAVINTIDSDSVIVPHCDSAVFHNVCLRVHVPLIVSHGTVFMSWHPGTFELQNYQMLETGKIYAFNNFEPHAVVKTDEGLRSHLICDMAVHDILDGDRDELLTAMLIKNQKSSGTFPMRRVTHNMESVDVRNFLGAKYGNLPRATLETQREPWYMARTREYLLNLVTNFTQEHCNVAI